MKTAIVYYSRHHGNTKKLVDAVAAENEVQLIDVTGQPDADLSAYDRIGLASGIYFNAFAAKIMDFAREHLPENRDVFFLYTYGAPAGTFLKAIRKITSEKGCRELGEYGCRGFDTFGPFGLVGGIAKGHPTAEEIRRAADFYRRL